VAHKAQAVSWIADAFPVGVKTDGLSGTPIQVEFYLRFGPRKARCTNGCAAGFFLIPTSNATTVTDPVMLVSAGTSLQSTSDQPLADS
jgi:hypothetical protein